MSIYNPKDFDRFKELSPAEERENDKKEQKTWAENQDLYWNDFFAEHGDYLQQGLDFYGNPYSKKEMGWVVSLYKQIYYLAGEPMYTLSLDCYVSYTDFPDFCREYGSKGTGDDLIDDYDFVEGE